MSGKIKLEDMVVYFICELIKATKRIYLIVSAICHRSIDQTCGTLSQGAGDLWAIAVGCRSTFCRRVRHDVGIIRRRIRGRGRDRS